ncbi:uncharacterized protein BYT42DRAFT_555879 [Radiomyces spectabilis]|uniref:uncharacterized protein n=1 Tax=Radiomyces spectabilis TaxID=64574 RepID=UPI00222100F9|nr:uncharacterized protein BYT42DRAFT_555879 [Radiomyces spectabilis]KAI8391171.1 hypothetical protein BYT42DRAFT_555879 [Radiomyces spectabilis]
MNSSRLVPLLLATGIGIGTGVYVFQPLLKEYEAETNGTWLRPGDKERFHLKESDTVKPKDTKSIEKSDPTSS